MIIGIESIIDKASKGTWCALPCALGGNDLLARATRCTTLLWLTCAARITKAAEHQREPISILCLHNVVERGVGLYNQCLHIIAEREVGLYNPILPSGQNENG
jgi:hypothetical protein